MGFGMKRLECQVCGDAVFRMRDVSHVTCDPCKLAKRREGGPTRELRCLDCGRDITHRGPQAKRCESCATVAANARKRDARSMPESYDESQEDPEKIEAAYQQALAWVKATGMFRNQSGTLQSSLKGALALGE